MIDIHEGSVRRLTVIGVMVLGAVCLGTGSTAWSGERTGARFDAGVGGKRQ